MTSPRYPGTNARLNAFTHTVTTASITNSGRQQPSRPSQPEVAELDPPRSGELPYQDVGDQVAAEREEHAHAQQSALRPAVAEVVDDDGGHGDRAQAVKPW